MSMLVAAALTFSAVAADLTGAQPTPGERGQAFADRTVKMNAADVFALADEARRRFDLRTAEAAYRALAEDPDRDVRAEALFRHGVMLAQAGQLREAALLLRLLLDERPEATAARLELANVLDRLGDKEAAYREVRAAQAAGLPPAVAQLVDRYSAALRNARPLGAGIEVAIAPDSNINRSTASDTLGTILGDFVIDPQSKGHSGTGLALRAHAFHRLAIFDQANLVTRVAGTADLYSKHRFNDFAVDLAVGPELRLGHHRINIELGATSRWFGQQLFVRSAKVSALWRRPVGQRTQVQLGGSAGVHDSRINDLQDGNAFSLQGKLEHALSPVMGIALTGTGERYLATDDGYSTTAWRAGFTAWRDLGRTTFTVGAQLGRLHADERLLLLPRKRLDRYRQINFGAAFRQLTLGGFAPVLRLTYERARSSIEFHDYRRIRSEVGVSRAF